MQILVLELGSVGVLAQSEVTPDMVAAGEEGGKRSKNHGDGDKF
jgi:hypothetical protein